MTKQDLKAHVLSMMELTLLCEAFVLTGTFLLYLSGYAENKLLSAGTSCSLSGTINYIPGQYIRTYLRRHDDYVTNKAPIYVRALIFSAMFTGFNALSHFAWHLFPLQNDANKLSTMEIAINSTLGGLFIMYAIAIVTRVMSPPATNIRQSPKPNH